MLILFFVGFCLLALFRCLLMPTKRLHPILVELWNLRYFSIAPVSFYSAAQYEVWHLSRRASMSSYFFPTSEYPETISVS